MNTLFLFDVSGQKIFDYLRNPQTTINLRLYFPVSEKFAKNDLKTNFRL